MRFPVFLSVLLWTVVLLHCQATTPVSYSTLSLPLQTPLNTQQGSERRSVAGWLRDVIIKFIWGTRTNHPESYSHLQFPESRAPRSLLARYGGDVVLRFNISTSYETKALVEAANTLFLDIWDFRADWVDICITKTEVPALLGLLPESLKHAHAPLMHDLALTVYESFPAPVFTDQSIAPFNEHHSFGPIPQQSRGEANLFFKNYQPLSVIVPWMKLLQSLFPSHVRLVNLGTSYEGRDILGLRVGVHPKNSERPLGPRNTIIITGGTHAREWIGVSTVNYLAYSFITSYGKSRQIVKQLEAFDWVFIPTINPDGYVYTWETDRLWRKNRQETSLRFCKGLDLDRTFSYQWDGEATQGNPCSENYAGDFPFEAVESLRLANWITKEIENNNMNVIGYLDIHSYSQQILYPFSYSCTDTPPGLENLQELGLGLAKAMRHVNDEFYTVGSACEGSVGSELNRGAALDWVYHDMQVKYAYQLKLRDNGNYGFLLPSKAIVPTGEEVLAAATFFGEFLANRFVTANVSEGTESTTSSHSSKA